MWPDKSAEQEHKPQQLPQLVAAESVLDQVRGSLDWSGHLCDRDEGSYQVRRLAAKGFLTLLEILSVQRGVSRIAVFGAKGSHSRYQGQIDRFK